MVEALRTASIVLAVLGAGMLAVLVVRRLVLSVAERRQAQLEQGLQPLALDVIDGESDGAQALDRRSSQALAVIVGRYAQRLAGDARANVATFFERRGEVAHEIAQLGSRREWRRATAAYLLGDMASSRGVPALMHALHDQSRDVRSAAARSLGLLRASEAVPRLVECLAGRTVPTGVAGFALVTIGDAAREPLRGLLGRQDPDVRATAAELLGFVGSPSDAGVLLDLLDDPAAGVRAMAAQALGRLGDEDAAIAVRAALDDRIPAVRIAAAQSLAALDDVDAAAALAEQARSDEYGPAQAAARALVTLAPQEAIAYGRAPGVGPHLVQAAGMAGLAR